MVAGDWMVVKLVVCGDNLDVRYVIGPHHSVADRSLLLLLCHAHEDHINLELLSRRRSMQV
jgi:hypothetical protein